MVLFIVLLIYIGSSNGIIYCFIDIGSRNGIIYCFTERLMYKQC